MDKIKEKEAAIGPLKKIHFSDCFIPSKINLDAGRDVESGRLGDVESSRTANQMWFG